MNTTALALADLTGHDSRPVTGTPSARAGRSHLAVVPPVTARRRGEDGATTAEYATVTGCGVGFAGLLYKFLTSDSGQQLLSLIFDAVKSLLPF